MVKPVWNNAQRANHQNFAKKTHPCAKKNMVPKAVLMKSGLVSINTAIQVNAAHTKTTVNAARSMSYLSKKAHSTVKRPIHKNTGFKNNNFNQRVNTVRPKAVVNAVKGNNVNAAKASACWVWKPKTKVLDHGNPQINLQDEGVIDSVCSRHMTGNMSYLTDYEEIDGGYVAFGGNPKGGKIPRKEAVNTAYYVQNIVLVVKPHNKTPYELFHGRTPTLSFMRPFGCPVTILNTIDHLGKFNGKADEGFFVGYSLNSKAFRVINSRTRIVEENLHIRFSESTPNAVGSEPDWLFDIVALTRIINYEPIVAGTQSNGFAGTKASDNAGQARKETKPVKNYILLPLWTTDPPFSHDPNEGIDQEKEDNVNSTNNVNVASTNEVYAVGGKTSIELPLDPNIPESEDYSIFENDEDDGAEADMNNLDTTIQVSPIPTTRIHKDHPLNQVIGDLQSATQTRRMSKSLEEHGFEEPKKVIHALKDPSWIKAIQEDLIQFKLQEVWTLVDLPNRKRAIGTKWVFRNKKDEKGIVIRNKARLVAQGFMVYQMDVKSVDLYGKIEEEVYVCQPPGFEDPDFLDRVYKVEKALYGLHQAPRAWYETLSTYLLDNEFQRGKIDKTLFIKRYKGDILLMSSMGELTFFLGLQVQQKKDGIFISQDKYVDEILKKIGFTEVKTASTPIETQKPLLKDKNGKEVDVHMYRSMIGSLMYLTSSRPDIMFAVCACARYQVNPKVSHLHAVKRIFRQNISNIAVSVNTARQVNIAHLKTTVNAGRPMSYLSKTAHSTGNNGNIVRPKEVVNAARPKAVVNVVQGNNVNAVKASACYGNPQMDLQDQGVIDGGCSRHLIGNMFYLTDYEEIDGGYVTFGENPKGGKITGRCTIKTARTPQQNGVAERRNRKLIVAARTMLDDSKLPTTFWAEAVNVACYVDNAIQARKETKPIKLTHFATLYGFADPPFSQDPKSSQDDGSKPSSDDEKKVDKDPRKDSESIDQEKDDNINSTNNVNAASSNEVLDDPNKH
ncbi:putative ribonuclease H-like domain-containing protein [Tanacetum coccineum]|uniref:Ribonuclease H-like domain-containing protein n=1 Tax=Tanacetum coccineum TaxID=301880 RepID=A0ABQ4Z0U4_9ASTR